MSVYDNENRFYNIDRILTKMENKNIIIENQEHTIQILNSLSYSTIAKGFKNTDLVDSSGAFKEKVNNFDLINLYRVDRDLCSILLKYILHIEQSINTNISNLISTKYGTDTSPKIDDIDNPNDYLCKNNFDDRPTKINTTLKILVQLKELIEDPHKNTPLKYYVENKNYIPPWILLNSMFLSNTISIYSIMKVEDKFEIANYYIPKQKKDTENLNIFYTLIYTIKDFRNILAHPNMLLKYKSKDRLILIKIGEYTSYKLIPAPYSDQKYRNSSAYSLLLSIVLLLDLYEIKLDFLFDFKLFLTKYSDFNFAEKNLYQIYNIPVNLLERIEKYYGIKV